MGSPQAWGIAPLKFFRLTDGETSGRAFGLVVISQLNSPARPSARSRVYRIWRRDRLEPRREGSAQSCHSQPMIEEPLGQQSLRPINSAHSLNLRRHQRPRGWSQSLAPVRAAARSSGYGSGPAQHAQPPVNTHLRINVNTALARRRGCSDGTCRYLVHGSVIVGRVRDSLSQ